MMNHGFKGPIVYNLGTRQVENRLWILDELLYIRVSPNTKSGITAVLGYEKKPPQLFRLEMTKAGESETGRAHLVFRHTYALQNEVTFSESCCFTGEDRELFIAAGKDGVTYIWDQESGALLHTVQPQIHGLTAWAWNPVAENPLMFATGSADGAVSLWRKPPEE